MTEPAQPVDISNAVAAGILKAVVVLVVIAAVVVVLYLIAAQNNDLGCATEQAERATNGQSTEDCD